MSSSLPATARPVSVLERFPESWEDILISLSVKGMSGECEFRCFVRLECLMKTTRDSLLKLGNGATLSIYGLGLSMFASQTFVKVNVKGWIIYCMRGVASCSLAAAAQYQTGSRSSDRDDGSRFCLLQSTPIPSLHPVIPRIRSTRNPTSPSLRHAEFSR